MADMQVLFLAADDDAQRFRLEGSTRKRADTQSTSWDSEQNSYETSSTDSLDDSLLAGSDARSPRESECCSPSTFAVPHIDFVMPLKAVGQVTRAVIESLFAHYGPRRLVVVTDAQEVLLLKEVVQEWAVPQGAIHYIEEDSFFVSLFGMSKSEFEPFYKMGDPTKAREFGWWWQQLLKLGAAQCIPDLSENFYVWDGDLIVLKPWQLSVPRSHGPGEDFHIAILQEAARSEFNKAQYKASVQQMLGMDPTFPLGEGTFVAHHMAFNQATVSKLVQHMTARLPGDLPWPAKLLQTSAQNYRMSEYMLYSTWVLSLQATGHDVPFAWHPYREHGATGLRVREPEDFLRVLEERSGGMTPTGYSLSQILGFFASQDEQGSEELPSHLQLEHVYGLRRSS